MTADARAALLLRCGRHPLAAEAAHALDRAGIPAGARAAVAVSGGADSVALLALCAGLAGHGRVAPVAVHVDHGLRPESPLDRDCAAEAAERLGVGFHERRLALDPGAGLPARARDARYLALAGAARDAGARWVFTAHHADDQAETVLLAMARGAGLEGLAGIAPVRELGDGVSLARPCLRMRRAELRAACADLGLPWREDPGNDRADTPRGRIRHRVLPELDAIAPGAAARVARAAEVAGAGAEALGAAVAGARGPGSAVARGAFRAMSVGMAASVLRAMVGESLDDAMLWRAADAARDPVTDPRRFPLREGGALLVAAREVRVEGQGSSPEP